jgi:hypothetical protein
MRDRLVTVPESLDLVPLRVLAAAAVAVSEVLGVVILKGLHAVSLIFLKGPF